MGIDECHTKWVLMIVILNGLVDCYINGIGECLNGLDNYHNKRSR